MKSGLDCWASLGFQPLFGKRIALLCNQASVTSSFDHIYDLLLPLHQAGKLQIAAIFGPQHGLYGHTQDNMIEWEGGATADSRISVYSLYGEHREPTDAMLSGVEHLVIDLQDVGARYYTFIWTMTLCLRACARLDIPVTVLDRANPINGVTVEGTVLDPAYASFVGLHPLPIRHGMTVGEIAHYVAQRFVPGVSLEVVRVEGWDPSLYGDEQGMTWAVPSPNMPTIETAVVYPGGCLIEATSISEGRGTTRPFEIIGAPGLSGHRLADTLNGSEIRGAKFRALEFQPTFNKHQGALCEGVFIHVMDRRQFEPVLCTIAILHEVRRSWPSGLVWKQPPYEYEFDKLPIDILAGNTWLREAIDNLTPLREVRERMADEASSFESTRRESLIYARP